MKKLTTLLTLLFVCVFSLPYGQAQQRVQNVNRAAAAPQSTPVSSFEIEGTVLKRFIGSEKEVVIPKGVTEIGMYAFQHKPVTSVVIPKGVTKIGLSAFNYCTSLNFVVIPDSVNEIKAGAFAECKAMKEWSISSTNPYFKRDGVGLLTKDGKKLVACLVSAKEYRIPQGVTEIGDSAFSGCRSLTSVVIPKGVTVIGKRAFAGCDSLTSVMISEGVTVIGKGAFSGCSSLTSLVIPYSVKKIEGGAFSGCKAMKEWSISSSHPYFKCVGISLLTKDGKKLVACPAPAMGYRIPQGVTVIGEGAFQGCMSLMSIEIPEGVTEIENDAFALCLYLKRVEIPKSVTEIGMMAFLSCSDLTICAPAGSKAESFAIRNRIPFQKK